MIKFIKDLWLIYTERAKARKALRVLAKQSWSVEFLLYLLTKATEMSKRDCHVVLKNREGQEMVIYAGMPVGNTLQKTEEDLDLRQGNVTLASLLDAAEVKGLL